MSNSIESTQTNPDLLSMRSADQTDTAKDGLVPTYGENRKILCMTEFQSPFEIQVGLGNIIPLWEKDMTLKWKFNLNSFAFYQQGDALIASMRNLIAAGMAAWGDAAPVKYEEVSSESVADFEVVMQSSANCNAAGACVLASAFFPDSGKHKMLIYPTMFQQSAEEQVETLAHEIGHTFGLRHYFAQDEGVLAVLYGEDARFSIMNYNNESVMTDTDRNDLKKLYNAVWSGEITSIRGLPVKLFKPFHALS